MNTDKAAGDAAPAPVVVDLDHLEELANAFSEGLAPSWRRWTWIAGKNGGYPQRVLSVGNVLLVAETYDDPDRGATVAPYLAALDPGTVLALVAEVRRLRERIAAVSALPPTRFGALSDDWLRRSDVLSALGGGADA